MSAMRDTIRKMRREALKAALRPFLSWTPLESPDDGFSIILGTPWSLRELLSVNLRFVEMTDTAELKRIHIVFDRPAQPAGDAFIEEVRRRHPGLPLTFHFHPPRAGWIVERIGESKFFASLNWVTGLAACTTRHAVLHDFDLYPLTPDLFTGVVEAMRRRDLRFSGTEHTTWDRLTEADALIGTWELGVDVQWLRRTRHPVDCFHAVARVNGRTVDLDSFSLIQSRTPERGLAEGLGRGSYAHVKNLCSTVLNLRKGRRVHVAWRLHYLWYLEALSDQPERLEEATQAMERSSDAHLTVNGSTHDFSGLHPTCANVLRNELTSMDRALFGQLRPQVARYLDAADAFFARAGGDAATARAASAA